jgi:Tol biopolymer transport system component
MKHRFLLPALLLASGCGHGAGTAPGDTGSLQVTVASAGAGTDDDGYAVRIDGGAAPRADRPVAANGTVTIELDPGEHTVALTGVAAACDVGGANPRTVTVVAGETASTSFTVSCRPVLRNRIVFSSDRDAGDSEIYVMNPDGTGQTRLTTQPGEDLYPAVSPDGTRIAYTREMPGGSFDVFVMNADGTGGANLTERAGQDYYSAWSPDGTRIAFTSDRNGDEEILVMNADGSGIFNLTNSPGSGEASSCWSPDGSRIVFSSTLEDPSGDLYVADADGTGWTRLTVGGGRDLFPAWSPDGARIAFMTDRTGDWEVFVMDADGSAQQNLTQRPASVDQAASWSPDGTRLAFLSDRAGDYEIFVMDADGSGVLNVSNAPGARDIAGTPQGWSP